MVTPDLQLLLHLEPPYRLGYAPSVLEDSRVGEVGGGGEEEAIDAEEVGGGRLMMACREDEEVEPQVGDGVEGEGLVFMLSKSLVTISFPFFLVEIFGMLFICPGVYTL
ncbi:hypothetical protein TorRG33x02_174000 [Trema orientale]|uniref:Transmembrane protein n=1 Tax=Trema orientale TaxID=63057 RepID=A0A2P5EMU1_TREOI|nr:hypothetical protein TorRG33x02_174000 [Trema orientale]